MPEFAQERFPATAWQAYRPARIRGPLRGFPKSGANTQKSKRPATSGTRPTTATTIPAVPPRPHTPQTTNARPATMRVMRPAGGSHERNKRVHFSISF